ncbi:MAG: site-specific DNA-methyltransferase, partial [Prevotella sp.]
MMDKMKMETKDLTQDNIEKIEELFPGVVTEAMDPSTKKVKKAVDFDALRQILSDTIVEGGSERYNFTWPGKKEAILEANRPIRKTLRPCIEESRDWNNTKNIYIKGDNLDALKLLRESYLSSIKMIYIDPPYNTGYDFIYRDSYKTESKKYSELIGEYDSNENIMFKNTDSNGRFHSDWCSMI